MTEHLPAKRALDALNKPAPDVSVKAARISARVRQAINLFVSGECTKITDAAERVGLARESLGRALDRPHVIAYLQMRTRRRLELLAARAGAVKGDLLNSPNEMVKDRASSFILGIAGIVPATDPQSARPGDHRARRSVPGAVRPRHHYALIRAGFLDSCRGMSAICVGMRGPAPFLGPKTGPKLNTTKYNGAD
jgi:hypothetical protein